VIPGGAIFFFKSAVTRYCIQMTTNMKHTAAFIVLIHITGLTAGAVPSLPDLFSDHMVLQRGKPIPVWGYADPGETVQVTLAGRSAQATAQPDGRWRARLEPLTAGGPFTLVIEGKTRIQVRDVLIGLIWRRSEQRIRQCREAT
jgi:sialate O-acetylesterase